MYIARAQNLAPGAVYNISTANLFSQKERIEFVQIDQSFARSRAMQGCKQVQICPQFCENAYSIVCK